MTVARRDLLEKIVHAREFNADGDGLALATILAELEDDIAELVQVEEKAA